MTKPLKLKGFVRGKFEVRDKYVEFGGLTIVRLKTTKSAEKLAADLNHRLSEIKTL
ncbi:MAG: hypothetical protein QNJ68_02805 [Microcoleaceae cyanobacterium MO_207.B10]|nr:hypothetical protein [Microcoleaceae cyanobacterium MO_207.B10]